MIDRLMYYAAYTLPSSLIYLLSVIIAEVGFKRRFGSSLIKPSVLLLLFLIFWIAILVGGVILGEEAIAHITNKSIYFLLVGICIWLVFRILPRPPELLDKKKDK